MNVSQAIRERRSIRKFLDKEIPKEILEEIIQEALWAPSGMNKQHWKVVVITGNKKKDLVKIFPNTENHIKPALEELFGEKMVNISLEVIRNAGLAPALVLVYTKSINKNAVGYNEKIKAEFEYNGALLSSAALIQNLLLSAHSRGIGSCWMTAHKYIEKEINDFLGIKDYDLVSVIPLGYPDQRPPAPPRKNNTVMWIS